MSLDNKLTVVMYHYVRDFSNTKYPKINGLDIRNFESQINYLATNFNFITYEMLEEHIVHHSTLPKRPILLTFDDGYVDHFEFVLPILSNRNISAIFFPPVNALTNGVVLDVNKIHYLLASLQKPERLIQEIRSLFTQLGYGVGQFERIQSSIDTRSRFDQPAVILVKRLLQNALPQKLRQSILNSLFTKYVADDEEAFARQLYMNENQLMQLVASKQIIGSHTLTHPWLEKIDAKQQRVEIEKSIEFVKSFCKQHNPSIAYPYGSFNKSTLDILRSMTVLAGFTTVPKLVELPIQSPLTIPRLDTNDLPID